MQPRERTLIQTTWILILLGIHTILLVALLLHGVMTPASSSEEIVAAVQHAQDAVVAVVSYDVAEGRAGLVRREVLGSGSGIVYDLTAGLLLTNQHVVEGGEAFEIVLAADQRMEATLLSRDLFSDLAILQVDPTQLQAMGAHAATFGNSNELRVGETVLVLGSPLDETFTQNVTMGVVSSTHRILPMTDDRDHVFWERPVIQTDAAINPGNSGGAVINLHGEVVGISNAKIALPDVEGMGFAIPITDALPEIEALVTEGKITRAAIGMYSYTMADLPPTERPEGVLTEGVLVQEVTNPENSLQVGDVLIAVDGVPVVDMVDLRTILFQHAPGDMVTVTYLREGKKEEHSLQLIPLDLEE